MKQKQRSSLILILLVAVLASSSFAAAVKDREGAVRDDRAALEKDARQSVFFL